MHLDKTKEQLFLVGWHKLTNEELSRLPKIIRNWQVASPNDWDSKPCPAQGPCYGCFIHKIQIKRKSGSDVCTALLLRAITLNEFAELVEYEMEQRGLKR